ncbi:MAG: PD40 domain-containing protein [Bacteroidetes bacterium]|nr:PD40 domain-containing protein [Bacteroidota bacterium]
MIRTYYIIIVFITFSVFCSYGQVTTEGLTADDFFDYQDYNRALQEYQKLYKNKKDDTKINLRIGLCYLQINDDRSKAIPFLQFVYNKGEYDKQLLLDLGKAYVYSYNFDEALKFFNDYRTKAGSKNYEQVDHYIENCENAKVMIKNPLNVTFENLGKEINSKYPDYYPFVSEDEGTFFFTSRREGNARKIKSWQGYFTADIYFSKVQKGVWTKAKNLGPTVNTAEDEECVSITPDGKTMIMYIDNELFSGDLFSSSSTKGKSFSKPVLLDEPLNSKDLELEGCFMQEDNILIVATDRVGGFGEVDLYMFKKLPNGKWGLPINLGANINTKYKEAFPVYYEQNHTLYFSSEGHTNMGGFDIFKSKFNPETQTFTPAENIGYPINTPEDNMQFSQSKNKRDGYISAVRKEGLGDLDIYKVEFNDVENRISVLKGKISNGDTLHRDIDAIISLTNVKTNEEIESKNVNPITGKYLFALEPGKYTLNVTSEGYDDAKQTVTIFDKSEYLFEIEVNIMLHKTGDPATQLIPVKNEKTPVNKKIK